MYTVSNCIMCLHALHDGKNLSTCTCMKYVCEIRHIINSHVTICDYFVRLAASKQSSALIGIYSSKLTSSGGWVSSDNGGASSMGSLMVELLQSSSGLLTFTLIVAAEDVLTSPGCPGKKRVSEIVIISQSSTY